MGRTMIARPTRTPEAERQLQRYLKVMDILDKQQQRERDKRYRCAYCHTLKTDAPKCENCGAPR